MGPRPSASTEDAEMPHPSIEDSSPNPSIEDARTSSVHPDESMSNVAMSDAGSVSSFLSPRVRFNRPCY